ncbi:hypothetical protein LOK49_LG09G00827, partial [Camellia lanceoleosa]
MARAACIGEVVRTESRGLSSDTIASLPSVNYKTQMETMIWVLLFPLILQVSPASLILMEELAYVHAAHLDLDTSTSFFSVYDGHGGLGSALNMETLVATVERRDTPLEVIYSKELHMPRCRTHKYLSIQKEKENKSKAFCMRQPWWIPQNLRLLMLHIVLILRLRSHGCEPCLRTSGLFCALPRFANQALFSLFSLLEGRERSRRSSLSGRRLCFVKREPGFDIQDKLRNTRPTLSNSDLFICKCHKFLTPSRPLIYGSTYTRYMKSIEFPSVSKDFANLQFSMTRIQGTRRSTGLIMRNRQRLLDGWIINRMLWKSSNPNM